MKQIMEEYGLGFVFSVIGVSFCAGILGFLSSITAV